MHVLGEGRFVKNIIKKVHRHLLINALSTCVCSEKIIIICIEIDEIFQDISRTCIMQDREVKVPYFLQNYKRAGNVHDVRRFMYM